MPKPILGPNGKPLLLESGKPAIADDPCVCCGAVEECDCTDRCITCLQDCYDAAYVTVTISGVVEAVSGCEDCVDLNASFELPFINKTGANTCNYGLTSGIGGFVPIPICVFSGFREVNIPQITLVVSVICNGTDQISVTFSVALRYDDSASATDGDEMLATLIAATFPFEESLCGSLEFEADTITGLSGFCDWTGATVTIEIAPP